jgi:hypothetical protein
MKWKRPIVFAVAAACWLLILPHVLTPSGLRSRADGLAAHHHTTLGEHGTSANPEWDLMRRMYMVLAFGNRALREQSDREASLAAMDALIDETRTVLDTRGPHAFLLPYSRREPFKNGEQHSLFVDGELTMMLAARNFLGADEHSLVELRRYVDRVAQQMESGPITCGESYPDECWTFCNTTALAALRIADIVLQSDHQPLIDAWIANAKTHLVDNTTGLLASSYTYDGHILDGPEGSSLWMSAHNLQLIDPSFARAQYDQATDHLAVNVLGFGLAREWPHNSPSRPDIDSGMIVPGLDASPGSSGLALVAAAAFEDGAFFQRLGRSLELAAAPAWLESAPRGSSLRFYAAGPMGEAVIFYAHEVGPLWRAVQQRSPSVAIPRR